MSALAPEEWVECIDDSHALGLLTAGALYCVSEILAERGYCYQCDHDDDAVAVAGVDFMWCTHRFRPLRDDAQIVKTKLREPVPA